jgi:hypothetical protein
MKPFSLSLAAHLGLLAAFSLMDTPAHSAPSARDWVVLDPLPDSIGYAGMAAGVLDGRLVATGGTQWSQPVWLKGTRKFNDEIFVLGALDQTWRVSSARLPVASGHFASAATGQAIYFAGGTHSGGCLATAYELRAEGGSYVTRRLADLPKAIGYAAGTIAENRFFLIGGVPDPASTQPSNEVWSLDLSSPTARWVREADLPGRGLLVPGAASSGAAVFAFGGMAFDAAGKPVPSAAAYYLPKAGGVWERLPDLPQPRVGINTPVPGARGWHDLAHRRLRRGVARCAAGPSWIRGANLLLPHRRPHVGERSQAAQRRCRRSRSLRRRGARAHHRCTGGRVEKPRDGGRWRGPHFDAYARCDRLAAESVVRPRFREFT